MISVYNSKSNGSNWLNRLRSSRGFPTGDENLDLDYFLTTHGTSESAAAVLNQFNSSKSNTTDSTRSESIHSHPTPIIPEAQATATSTSRNRDDQNVNNQRLGNTCAYILCDLFNFGEVPESYRLRTKKSSRKQRNPKFCVLSTSAVCSTASDDLAREKGEQNGLVSSGDNSLNKKREENGKKKDLKEKRGENVGFRRRVNVGKDLGRDSKLYSRNDIAVIDTSIVGWKSEKVVFRKYDDVWKVKEKKSWTSIFVGRKRKAGGLSDKNEDEKKLKGSVWDDSVEELKGNEEDGVAAFHGRKADNGKMEECSKEVMGADAQVLSKGFPGPRSGQMLQNGSSVILVKPVPKIGNSGAKRVSKTSLKKAPKRFISLQRS